jgi:hypothetical protein
VGGSNRRRPRPRKSDLIQLGERVALAFADPPPQGESPAEVPPLRTTLAVARYKTENRIAWMEFLAEWRAYWPEAQANTHADFMKVGIDLEQECESNSRTVAYIILRNLESGRIDEMAANRYFARPTAS